MEPDDRPAHAPYDRRITPPPHLPSDRLVAALDAVNDGLIVVGPDWVIEYANGVAATLVEHSVDELVGRGFWDVFPEAYDHDFGKAYRRAMESGTEERLEQFYGPLRGWFDVRAVPTGNGLTFCFQNVNERRAAAAAQESLVRVITSLAGATTVEEIEDALAGAVGDVLGIEGAGVAFVGSDTVMLGPGDERALDEQDADVLQMLAAQAQAALERTRVLTRQRAIAETLQQAMLPISLPHVPGAEIAACYVAATADVFVGGDWYDAVALPDGRVVLAVGDVAGHGIEAAAAMGQVRNALRAYAMEGHEPAAILQRLDQLIDRAGHDLFTTALVAVYDPATGRLRWSNAGHLPPLVRSASGVQFLESLVGTPVGVHGPGVFVEAEIVLEPDDLFVAYTDGLVERRGEDLDVGLERLRAALECLPPTTEAPCDALVAELAGGSRGDDVCVFALRRSPR